VIYGGYRNKICGAVEFAALYRQRLADVSWFMRVLNETIARQANTSIAARLAELQGRAFEPVRAPVVAPEVVGEIDASPARTLPGSKQKDTHFVSLLNETKGHSLCFFVALAVHESIARLCRSVGRVAACVRR
jgi:hypothetical protein